MRPLKEERTPEQEKRFEQSLGRKAERKLRAGTEKYRPIWFGLGGWAVAIPTLPAIVLGLWVDERRP